MTILEKCYCPGCNKHFAGIRAHELHRVGEFKPGERRCLTTNEMVNRGFTLIRQNVRFIHEEQIEVKDVPVWHEPKVKNQV
jgi:hypothetical protein